MSRNSSRLFSASSLRSERREIFEAFVAGGEQREMRGALAARHFVFVHHGAGGEVGLAADDALHLGLFGGHVKVDGAVEIAMVGHGHGRHVQLLHAFHERINAHSAV
jgi:hypothetical protein